MDYIALIHSLIDPIVSNPEAILIKEIKGENEKNIEYLICASDADCARLIGKKGCIANSLRELVSVGGKLDEKRIHLKFESLNSEEK